MGITLPKFDYMESYNTDCQFSIVKIWNVVIKAELKVSKLALGVPEGKLNFPPKTCIPKSV